MNERIGREPVFIDSLANQDQQPIIAAGMIRLQPGVEILTSHFEGPAELDIYARCGPEVRMGRYVGVGRFSSVSRTDIGNFCTVGFRSSLNPFNHPMEWLSIHEFQYHESAFDFMDEYREFRRLPREAAKAARSRIGNDVWIGNNANIMAGVTIGDGAVVGAGSVVLHDVPPYAVVAGVPAQVRRMRFDPETIARLLAAQWWNLELKELSGLPFNDVQRCLDELEGMQAS